MSVNNLERDHFFGEQRLNIEAENPEKAKPVVAKAPQVPGARYNPVAIAEPTDPPSVPVKITRDERGNVEQADLEPEQVEELMVPVAGGAQVGFTADPRPEDIRRSAVIEHQAPSDLTAQTAEKKAEQERRANQAVAAAKSASK